jgi:1-phosphatidylinositol-3-phosphate 5-kinase
MTQHEVQLFLEIAPNYLSYIRRALEGGQPTLLGKIIGVYRVGFRSTAGVSSTGSSTKKTNFLVMENLFYERSITQRFDLKGSVRNRLVEPTLLPQGEEIVLLDENLLKSNYTNYVFIFVCLFCLPNCGIVLNGRILIKSNN